MKNLLSHEKVSKYYEHDCLQMFLLSWLKAFIVKKSHVLVGIFIMVLIKHPRSNLKDFQYQICPSVKRSGK